MNGIETRGADNKKKGEASKAMDKLLAEADKRGLEVKLKVLPKPNTKGGLTTNQLKDWYKKKGFIEDTKTGEWTRKPKVAETTTTSEVKTEPIVTDKAEVQKIKNQKLKVRESV